MILPWHGILKWCAKQTTVRYMPERRSWNRMCLPGQKRNLGHFMSVLVAWIIFLSSKEKWGSCGPHLFVFACLNSGLNLIRKKGSFYIWCLLRLIENSFTSFIHLNKDSFFFRKEIYIYKLNRNVFSPVLVVWQPFSSEWFFTCIA